MNESLAPPVYTDLPHTHIEPSKGWMAVKLRELWEFRELIYFLVWRDIKVRYKQTILGAAWAIIQPFTTMVILSVFFGALTKMPSDGIPYPAFSYAALVPWSYFAEAVRSSSNSLVANTNMIRKVYFPRLILPITGVLTGVVDTLIAFTLLIGIIFYYGFSPTLNVLWVPLLFLQAVLTALAVGLWLSALNVQFRDIRYTIAFLIQAWFYATPIAYPSSLLDEPWRTLYGINPMAGVVEGFRWALLGTETAPGPIMIVSVVTTLVLLVAGAFYFRRMERMFADVV